MSRLPAARLLAPVAACLVAAVGVGCGSPAATQKPAAAAQAPVHRLQPERAVVDHVVDGDTLDVRVDRRFARVRTLQIDAPESSSTRYGHPDECGAAAKRYAASLTAPGRTVTLEFAGNSLTDAYRRLLALVHLGDARAITWQEEMVRGGWAKVLVYRGNTTPLLPTLRADAAYAKARRLGVWAVCHGRFHDRGDRHP